MNLLYLGCHVIYCPNSKHFKSWWESYYMYSVTKSTKWAVKDKSGYMSTLVMLIRTIFQGKWPLLQRGWRGCPSWWGGKTLILNGRPERWEQQSMILSLSVAWLYHLHAEGTHIHIWGAGTFLWSTPGEATSWGLWAEVLSPASQLTNPQHCSEGLSCEPWEESFLNQGLQSQPLPLTLLLFTEGVGRRVGLSCCHLVMPHASVIVFNLFPPALEGN